MFNIADRIESMIELHVNSQREALLDSDWGDTIAFHDFNIHHVLKSLYEHENGEPLHLTHGMLEAITDYLCANQETYVQYVEFGTPQAWTHRQPVSLGCVGELEIQLPDNYTSPARRALIESRSDLVVNANGFAYYNLGYDYIGIVLTELDLNAILEDAGYTLESPIVAID